MKVAEDLSGRKFLWFAVVSRLPDKNKFNQIQWLCWCKCGNTFHATGSALRNGDRSSCGCMRNKIRITHGKTNTLEYKTWQGIMQRCYNNKSTGYENYGARGIVVCDRWLRSFENFFEDMGPKPTLRHSIERRDNDGNYEPGNCIWALPIEQLNNKRNNAVYLYKGERKTLSQLAVETGIKRATLAVRLQRGATIEEAVTKKVRPYPQKIL